MRFFHKTYITKAKAPRKGRAPIRRTTETSVKLSALSKKMGNAVQIDLVDGITTFKKRISVEALASAWETGDYAKVTALIPWQALPGDLAATLSGIADATAKAASFQLEKLPPNINENLRFDVSNPKIRNFVSTRSASLVTGIEADVQKTIQDAVARSFTEAATPRRVAEQIKGSIGLLPAHERALDKYRTGLVTEGIPQKQIDKLAGQYEDRLLDYRANMIARTEIRAAVNTGQMAVWQEGVNQGYIDRAGARKEWIAAGADPCPTCDPMDGRQVQLDEPWIITYPNGETKAVQRPDESHPSCFCNMELHFIENEGQDTNELTD